MEQNKTFTATYINGKPYAVVLPTSNANKDRRESMWDNAVSALGPYQSHLHFGNVFSWCQNSPNTDLSFRWIRGFSNARSQDYDHHSSRTPSLGYRPFLIPLNPDTLMPDPSQLESYKDGTEFCMGSLYMNNSPLDNPQTPTIEGDIPDYFPGSALHLGDSHEDPRTHIQWLKAGNCLIADRNLLKNISWEDLDKFGLVYGNQKQRDIENIQDAYMVISQMDPTVYDIARNMRYIETYMGKGQLPEEELIVLAEKLHDLGSYSDAGFLNEEYLDAACYLLSYGVEKNHCPDFPEVDASATKGYLLSADMDVFSTLIETIALNNQKYYAPDNRYSLAHEHQLQKISSDLQCVADTKTNTASLTEKISHANSRVDHMCRNQEPHEFIK